MISETAFFIKDVIGPKGSVSIISEDDIHSSDSDNIENHTRNNCLKIHSSELDNNGEFVSPNKTSDIKEFLGTSNFNFLGYLGSNHSREFF